jgi:hypothetical protein
MLFLRRFCRQTSGVLPKGNLVAAKMIAMAANRSDREVGRFFEPGLLSKLARGKHGFARGAL